MGLVLGINGDGAGGDDLPDECFELGVTCSSIDGKTWVAQNDGTGVDEFPLEPGASDGFGDFGGAMVLLFVVGVIIAVATLAYRIWMARDMARDGGLDPNQATAMTLLSGDEGLSATYLASSLRRPPHGDGDASAEGEASRPSKQPVAERLRQLEKLKEDGLITLGEYDERRRRILDDL